jgi:hypothetical protein
MLKEVRDDNRENDAEHMKPVRRLLIQDQSTSFVLIILRTGNHIFTGTIALYIIFPTSNSTLKRDGTLMICSLFGL